MKKTLKSLKEAMGNKKVPVYHADRKTLVGHVSSSATSIGAAKLAKKKSARFEKVDGKYGWVAESLDKALKEAVAPLKTGQMVKIALDHLGEKPDYYTRLKKVEESYSRKGQPEEKFKMSGEASSYDDKTKKWNVVNKDFSMSGRSRKHALNKALNFLKKVHPNHKQHEVKIQEEAVLLEFQKDDMVTIHYGAHNHEPHRVTAVHPGNKLTILPTRPRGRSNRYPGGELTVDRSHLHPFEYQITELHDEPDRPGVGIGRSNTEGMSMTEEPRKTLKLSKADWDHHTRHSTAQYDHEGKPWIVQKDTSGAAIRIPVQITEEDYPHKATIWKVLKEALPKPEEREDNAPPSKTSEIVKGAAKKDKSEKKDDASKLSIGKTKDTFEPEPVLTPVLSIANMPGGSVR